MCPTKLYHCYLYLIIDTFIIIYSITYYDANVKNTLHTEIAYIK